MGNGGMMRVLAVVGFLAIAAPSTAAAQGLPPAQGACQAQATALSNLAGAVIGPIPEPQVSCGFLVGCPGPLGGRRCRLDAVGEVEAIGLAGLELRADPGTSTRCGPSPLGCGTGGPLGTFDPTYSAFVSCAGFAGLPLVLRVTVTCSARMTQI